VHAPIIYLFLDFNTCKLLVFYCILNNNTSILAYPNDGHKNENLGVKGSITYDDLKYKVIEMVSFQI
jgi:hypothetical protein